MKQELDLQRNRIMTLPWAIGTLDSLTQLQLHSNLLTSCPPTMSNLVNIRILTLRDNQVRPRLKHPPSTRNPQPSTLNPQPSTLNPQPSTLNPQPSTLNPQPSTLNHLPLNP